MAAARFAQRFAAAMKEIGSFPDCRVRLHKLSEDFDPDNVFFPAGAVEDCVDGTFKFGVAVTIADPSLPMHGYSEIMPGVVQRVANANDRQREIRGLLGPSLLFIIPVIVGESGGQHLITFGGEDVGSAAIDCDPSDIARAALDKLRDYLAREDSPRDGTPRRIGFR